MSENVQKVKLSVVEIENYSLFVDGNSNDFILFVDQQFFRFEPKTSDHVYDPNNPIDLKDLVLSRKAKQGSFNDATMMLFQNRLLPAGRFDDQKNYEIYREATAFWASGWDRDKFDFFGPTKEQSQGNPFFHELEDGNKLVLCMLTKSLEKKAKILSEGWNLPDELLLGIEKMQGDSPDGIFTLKLTICSRYDQSNWQHFNDAINGVLDAQCYKLNCCTKEQLLTHLSFWKNIDKAPSARKVAYISYLTKLPSREKHSFEYVLQQIQ